MNIMAIFLTLTLTAFFFSKHSLTQMNNMDFYIVQGLSAFIVPELGDSIVKRFRFTDN